ncbi:MAG TPA: glycosyl hydrolase family 28 protein [Verrucomicrobiae bacterium]|nr:glycosyl hydrolase family 28 protein [Verrucomicrobiae bacterium]
MKRNRIQGKGTRSLVAGGIAIPLLALFGLATHVFAAAPPLPQIPTNQFFITNFGAYGNSASNNASAIQSAINAAGTAGGGTVIVSAVGVLTNYLSGPINLTNNVSLQINAGTKLQMLAKGSWPSSSIPFINGTNLHDVVIAGSGTIDGQGSGWWSGGGTRPYLVNLSACTRILIENVTAQNSPMYHFALMGGNNGVTVQGITVNTISTSPNTDGIDLTATNSLIQNCYISDGDDNISIKCTGFATVDTVVSNCTFGAGHGVSVGSDTSGGVRDLIVSNCAFNATNYGIRLKSDNAASGSGAGGLVENLAYYDLSMTNVQYPFVLYSYYNESGTPNNITPQTAAGESVGSTNHVVIWRNITVSNLTATALTGDNISGIIWGRLEMVVSNVTLDDVNIYTPTKTFCIYNARDIRIMDSNLAAPSTTSNTLTLFNAQITVTNSVLATTMVKLGGLAVPSTNNILALFNTRAVMTDTNLLGANPMLTLGDCVLTISNGLSLGSASVLNMALGTNIAEIAITGSLKMGGALNVTDGGGFAPATYTLLAYGGTLTGGAMTMGTTPNPGFTYAISTSTVGQVNLLVTNPNPPADPFVLWQLQYFGCTNCLQAQPGADPLGKGMSNTNQFLVGLNPTNPSSLFQIVSVAARSNDAVVTWAAAAGHTNEVQVSRGDVNGGYATNTFADIPASLTILPGSGNLSTNYIDAGGATNVPARYYRIRLVP